MLFRPLLRRLRSGLGACLRDRHGATAIEYGLIAALVVLGMLLAMRNLAGATVSQLNKVDTEVDAAVR